MTFPLKATKKEWIGLAVLALPCILATMDLTVLNLAVPYLSADLKPSSSQLLWIMDIYGFFIAGSLITMGTLGDRIGRRKLLLMGAAAFGCASTLAAFSKSAEMLIVTRALLGVAGATLAPSTLSLIRNMFHDEHERTVAIGIWVTCFSVGAAIGPVLGGILLHYFHWSSVFLLNVPVMILLLILGPLLLPEFYDKNAGRLDLASAGLSLTSILLIIYGLKKMAEEGFVSVSFLSITVGLIIGAILYRRQKTLTDPLIDVSLFRSPSFSVSLALNMFGCFIAFGTFFFTGQYMQLVLGLSPLEAGLWGTPPSLAFIVGSMWTPQLLKKYKPAYVITVGLFIAALGFGFLAQLHATSSIAFLLVGLTTYSLGITPIFIITTDLIVGSVPPERAGAAASMSETSTEFGGALGMAVLGSIGTAYYRLDVAKTLSADIPPRIAEAARSTLGAAVAAMGELPIELQQPLLVSTRDAFVSALRLVSGINVIVVLVLAGLALKYLRRR